MQLRNELNIAACVFIIVVPFLLVRMTYYHPFFPVINPEKHNTSAAYFLDNEGNPHTAPYDYEPWIF